METELATSAHPAIRRLPLREATLVRSACALPSIAAIAEELVLNALDAGASEVSVSVDVLGCYIQVRDNGCGIDLDGLRMIGDRHVTSKLASLADLDSGEAFRTFGFRGEALHILGTVSVLEIISCAAAAPSSTHAAVLRFGLRQSVGPAHEVRAVGTTVTARDLFANRSVSRKQHQRPGAAAAEVEQARSRLMALAIAHPAVALRLHDLGCNLTVLRTSITSSPLSSLRASLGELEPPPMAPLAFMHAGFSLEGFAAVPPAGHRSRECQHLFLNQRPLSPRTELHQLLEAALTKVALALTAATAPTAGGSAQAPTSVPHAAFVLFLRCPPSCFDLTLEPDKSDATFIDGGLTASLTLVQAITRFVSMHCEPALSTHAASRLIEACLPTSSRRSGVGSGARGGSASATAGTKGIKGSGTGSRSSGGSRSASAATGSSEGGGAAGSSEAARLPPSSLASQLGLMAPLAPITAPLKAPKRPFAPLATIAPRQRLNTVPVGEGSESARSALAFGSLFDPQLPWEAEADTLDNRTQAGPASALPGAPMSAAVVSTARLERLVAFAQLERKFILATADHALYAIDQHAADERVQLEALLRATVQPCGRPLAGSVGERALRPPARLVLTPHEHATLRRHRARLAEWGWRLREEGMDARTLMLDAMPQLQSVDLGERAMLEYAQALEDTAGGSTLAPPAVLRVLASKACRRAIMFGDTLSVPQCQALLKELARCEQPLQCAHGRPTIATLVDLAALRLPERMEGDL